MISKDGGKVGGILYLKYTKYYLRAICMYAAELENIII